MAESWLTRTMQAMPGATAWVSAIGLWVALCILAPLGMLIASIWWDAAVPSATVHATVPNPAGSLIAVVETVDNGMGFGQGMLYDEIHVLRPGDTVTEHGNDSATVIFYIENDSRHQPPALRWTDDGHLTIGYQANAGARPGVRPGAYGVSVRAESRAATH